MSPVKQCSVMCVEHVCIYRMYLYKKLFSYEKGNLLISVY